MSNLPRTLILGTSLLLATLAGAPGALPQTPAMPPGAPPGVPPAVPLLPAPTVVTELPAFQPGLWEYQRTVLTAADPKPQKSSIRKCSDPSSEIKQRMSELQRKGCQFSPLLTRGKQYLSTWRCPVSSGALIDRNVVTVHSDVSYQDDNEVHAGEHMSRSTVVANRLGECPPQGSGHVPGTTPAPASHQP